LHRTAPKKGGVVTQAEWEWPIAADLQKHHERVALLRPIPYEMTTQTDGPAETGSGKALSLNISSGGMLVLMQDAPDVEQVLKVLVPTPTSLAGTPTLAEVRWVRKMPFSRGNGTGPFFVGLKFLF
jgi:PilZ domain-containing protein